MRRHSGAVLIGMLALLSPAEIHDALSAPPRREMPAMDGAQMTAGAPSRAISLAGVRSVTGAVVSAAIAF